MPESLAAYHRNGWLGLNQYIYYATVSEKSYSKVKKEYTYNKKELIVKEISKPHISTEIKNPGKPCLDKKNNEIILLLKNKNKENELYEIQF